MLNRLIVYITALLMNLQGIESKPPEKPIVTAAEPIPTCQAEILPVPPGLEPRVEFWTKVFSEVPSSRTLIYHRDHPEIVYSVVRLEWLHRLSALVDDKGEEYLRNRREGQVVTKYRKLLNRLDQLEKKPGGLKKLKPSDPDYYRLQQLAAQFRHISDPDKYLKAAASGAIRTQRGRADEFKKVYLRVQHRLPALEAIFAQENVPPSLTRLAFIESMFDPQAVSEVGAAGIWQLMPETARHYLEVSETNDQRLDLRASTRAAAKLLRQNFTRLGDWPLAVTAYNTGGGRMERAQKSLKTNHLPVIIEKYDDPNFGFAGHNFYAELLAVLAAEENILRSTDSFFAAAPHPTEAPGPATHPLNVLD